MCSVSKVQRPAQQSPFVIAFARSGVSVLPSIINVVVCTSAISSASACVFIASRTLYGLSCDGHAPKLFQRCDRFGTPHYAVGLTCVLFPLVYLNVANSSSVVFSWFVNITTVVGLIGWIVIEVTYLRLRPGLKVQGYSRRGIRSRPCVKRQLTDASAELPYKSPGQPYVSWITLLFIALVVFFSGGSASLLHSAASCQSLTRPHPGFDVFTKGNFTAPGFLICYLNVFIFAGECISCGVSLLESRLTCLLSALYVFFKVYLRSKGISPSDMDFETEFASIRQ
jgi:amino acid transporter